MSSHYFTPEEVNELLPEIEPILGDLLQRRAKVARAANLMTDIVGSKISDVGSAEASNLVVEFMAIERLVNEIRDFGCEIKDLNGGLIDFLALRNGREVYICWRYGEPTEVVYYHDLHAGFAGRQEIDPTEFSSEK